MARKLAMVLLVLLIGAFAGRPVAYCLMRGTIEAKAAHVPAPKKAGHCHEAPAPEPACMVDLDAAELAPAAAKSPVPAVAPAIVAAVDFVRVIAAPRLAPSRTRVTAYESPPASITILRI